MPDRGEVTEARRHGRRFQCERNFVYEVPRRLAGSVVCTANPATTSFSLLCVLNGKLAAGLRCAEAMPAKATVRLTGGGTMEVKRRTSPFTDRGAERTFAAPYAPSFLHVQYMRWSNHPVRARG